VTIPDGHASAERRSLAYHRVVAARLDAQRVEHARRLVARWAAEGTLADPYAQRWRALLDLELADLAAALVRDDEPMRDLRQCSPFAGVLEPHERWRILREVR